MNREFEEFVKLMHDTAIANNMLANGTFTLTSRCNLHCKMCYICNPHIEKEELSGEQWLDVMKQARDLGMAFCLITGGEPLLHKDFWEIYTGLKKLGVYITINTNGTMITPEVADRFAKSPPLSIQISIYGSSPEAYKRVTGSASAYEKTMRGIKLLQERGFEVKLRTLLTKETAPDIENIVRLILSFGVPIEYSNYIMPVIDENGNDYKAQRLNAKEVAKYTEIIKNVIKDYYDVHGNPHEEAMREAHERLSAKPVDPKRDELTKRVAEIKGNTAFACSAGISSFCMSYDGFIHPCIIAVEPIFDLKKMNMNLKEGLEKLKEGVLRIKPIPECVGCPDKKDCMVCPALHYNETGRWDKQAEYMCEYVRAGVKLIE